MCGEKPLVSFVADFSRGSPPRMRGKAPINRHQAEEHGVTPACAGKSAGTGSRSGASWDHPPTVRGKERLAKNQRSVHGITPAYAGKRHNDRNGQVTEKDHPRVCGEKSRSGLNLPRSWGSPPRMRGKVKTPQKGLQGPRITPAYAGKRPLASLTTSTAKDHPRVCGEKYNYGMANKQAGGSPPRMRGKGGRWPEP